MTSPPSSKPTIFSHPDKGKLFLPPDAPQPHDGSRLLSLTSLAPDGLAITGGFFGLPTAVTQHGLDKVVSLQPRIDGIVSPALAKNTQAAMKLLGECATHALDYYARITPPSLAAPALEAWDGAIEKARHDILQLEDHADPGLPERIRLRSSALAQLSTKLPPPIWLASVLRSMTRCSHNRTSIIQCCTTPKRPIVG